MDWKEVAGIIGGLAFIYIAVFLFIPPFQPNISFLNISSFGQALWSYRSLDVFLQLLLILSGVLGFLVLIKNE